MKGGTRYGCDIRSGGTNYSATDGPGGPFLRGDHPRRDRSCTQAFSTTEAAELTLTFQASFLVIALQATNACRISEHDGQSLADTLHTLSENFVAQERRTFHSLVGL